MGDASAGTAIDILLFSFSEFECGSILPRETFDVWLRSDSTLISKKEDEFLLSILSAAENLTDHLRSRRFQLLAKAGFLSVLIRFPFEMELRG